MPDEPLRLSILDHAPVTGGQPVGDAFRHSTELAQRAQQMGYTRYWLAEHHNMVWLASSSPTVLAAHIAANTSTIRVGTGGLMLPNYAPLSVAEQMGMLEALHPGRIDLGLGRSPGGDRVAAHALGTSERDYAERFAGWRLFAAVNSPWLRFLVG